MKYFHASFKFDESKKLTLIKVTDIKDLIFPNQIKTNYAEITGFPQLMQLIDPTVLSH